MSVENFRAGDLTLIGRSKARPEATLLVASLKELKQSCLKDEWFICTETNETESSLFTQQCHDRFRASKANDSGEK
jgi:hypothetical protein